MENVQEISAELPLTNDPESVPNTSPETLPKDPAESLYARIAEQVRGDSENHSRLTHIEDLGPLFPDMTPEEIMAHVGDMVKLERYQDLQVLVLPGGAGYLYSNTFIAADDAEQKAAAEEVMLKIASKVRGDSQGPIQLTPLESLRELLPEREPNRIDALLAVLSSDERFGDIRPMKGPSGISYLYSALHMTGNYATILARIAAKDPTTTIAETVREESRVYPRPTKLELFYTPLFEINPDEMKAVVQRTLEKPENKDLKQIVAPTGAIYLYSDRYMSPPLAERWVQWEEVERLDNP